MITGRRQDVSESVCLESPLVGSSVSSISTALATRTRVISSLKILHLRVVPEKSTAVSSLNNNRAERRKEKSEQTPISATPRSRCPFPDSLPPRYPGPTVFSANAPRRELAGYMRPARPAPWSPIGRSLWNSTSILPRMWSSVAARIRTQIRRRTIYVV